MPLLGEVPNFRPTNMDWCLPKDPKVLWKLKRQQQGLADQRGGLPPCSAMWTFGMMTTSPAAKYLTTHRLPSWVQGHIHIHLHHTIHHGCNAGNIMEYLFVGRATIGKLRRIMDKDRKADCHDCLPIFSSFILFFDGNYLDMKQHIWHNLTLDTQEHIRFSAKITSSDFICPWRSDLAPLWVWTTALVWVNLPGNQRKNQKVQFLQKGS